jgi:hypothetical protein
MAHVSSKDDGGSLGQERRWGCQERIHASKFDVHFEANIGAVLFLGVLSVVHLQALGGDADDSVTDSLDLGIQGSALVWEKTHQELRLRFDGITGS